MKYLLVAGLLVILLTTCKKSIQGDSLYIRGRLFLLDTITQNAKGVPLSKKNVVIAYDNGDTLNYLFNDTTDINGYFVFTLPSTALMDKYIVRYEDSIKGFYYRGIAAANKGNDNVLLTAVLDNTKQNGFIIHLVDSNGQPVPSVSLQLFNNETLSLVNNPNGAVMSIPVNEYGNCYKINLPPGFYYLNGAKTIDSVSYSRVDKKILVNEFGIITDTMVLNRVIPTNGFILTSTDSSGGFISKANVYLYSSLVLALTNDPTAALNTFISDSTGKVVKNNILPGQYYVNAVKNADTLKLKRIAKPILITPSNVITDTIILK